MRQFLQFFVDTADLRTWIRFVWPYLKGFIIPAFRFVPKFFPESIIGNGNNIGITLLCFHFGNQPVYFSNLACGIIVSRFDKQSLVVVLFRWLKFPCFKLLVGLPDQLIVLFGLLLFQFGLKAQNGNQVINFGNPVLWELLIWKNPACRFVIVESKDIVAPVEFSSCFFQ